MAKRFRAGHLFGPVVRSALLLSLSLVPGPAWAAQSIDACSPAQVRLYLALARASENAYDEAQPGLETTPSGSIVRISEDADGNLIIAFRGSMLGDRKAKHRFSNLGGENIRRNYRDWVATNFKQAAGFLPRQYAEAAALVEEHARTHPADKLVYITGHSKGGGAATYAYVAAGISPELTARQKRRMRCVTFNAAVVREQNWRRLFQRHGHEGDRPEREPGDGVIHALIMEDDPVSKIAASEERRYVKRIYIGSGTKRTPNEQHGIHVMVVELENRVKGMATAHQ